MTELEDINVTPDKTRDLLNKRQIVDCEVHMEQLAKWCLNIGKDPDRPEGYSKETIKIRLYRIDYFYRFVWDKLEENYTTNVTHYHADEFMKHLAYTDYSDAYKSQFMKSLKMLFNWRHHEFGEEKWTPEITFYEKNSGTNPRDFFTKDERAKLRKAALEYGSIPSYSNLSAEERVKWKTYLL